jgi:hypothetical protein
MRRASCVTGVALLGVLLSGHVGSPNVFFSGKAGPYDIRVVVRPPEVVPGVARVTVRTSADVRRVAIRPVFWRAGSKGAPSADETRRLEGQSGTFEGSLWLMARGAYSVSVTVDGPQGTGTALVPVAAIATGRLAMSPVLAALLSVLGVVLLAGLITIVYKGAGESLQLEPKLDPVRRRRAQRVAALAIPILALAVFGGARWWNAVDRDYQRTIYRPSPLKLTLEGSTLQVQASDTLWQLPGRPSALVPDHGKLMHLFLVRADDARAFAHLHPVPDDSSEIPPFRTTLPALPAGRYHVFGDVVHETGFERTLVASIVLPDNGTVRSAARRSDPDDAWFAGDATPEQSFRLADGSTMQLEIAPGGVVRAETEETFRIRVRDPRGNPAQLEPYLGMTAHAVVARLDGSVYVHLHPMGTITTAAQQAFLARDRGDTTAGGRLRLDGGHARHSQTTVARPDSSASVVEFPYAFPGSGSYRLFVQVRQNGRILTGAFAINVAEPAATP